MDTRMQGQERKLAKAPRSESADEIAVKQILAGNRDAFDLLVYHYQKQLFSFICHYLRDDDLACDITQNVFLQLYLSLPTLRTDGSLKGWLYRVARNRCLDELRRK